MQKSWSILFAVMMVLCLALYVVAAFVPGWWLPKNVSSYGDQVDFLYYFILAVTGFFFILTEALLVYFMYVYAGGPGHVFGHHYGEERVLWTSFFKRIFKPVTALIHDQHRLEITWTLVPGIILLVIALVQIRAWAEIKYHKNMPRPDANTLQMEVTARQWEWRIRYPSPRRMAEWEKNPELAQDFASSEHLDDVHTVNEFHVWKGDGANLQRVLIHLKTSDVLHSLFFPNLRLKQDALPGKVIPVWFAVTEANTVPMTDPTSNRPLWAEEGYDPAKGTWSDPGKIWEVACAEYCGARHSLMRGKLYVHKDKADFLAWLRQAEAEQKATQPQVAAAK